MVYHLQAGTMLENRYRIEKVIGHGGFGITYQGIDEHIQAKVAIKELFVRAYMGRVEGAADTWLLEESYREPFEKARERFLKEAIIVGIFHQDPGVVKVLDHFRANGTAYIVMEYVEGVTLAEYLEKEGSVPAEQLFRTMLPLIKVLGKIHENEVIHRDISPENLMVLPDGSMKLIDFGAARQYTDEREMSQIVKDGYAPAEQWNKDGKQGPWTDVYALCAVLYRCLTGKQPESAVQRMFYDELQKPSELGISIDPTLEKILLKGMEILPEDRYQSMKELYEAIQSVLPEPEQSDPEVRKKRKRKQRIAAGMLAAALILVCCIFGYRIYKEKNKFKGIETETVILSPDPEMPATEYLTAKRVAKERAELFFQDFAHEIKEEEEGHLTILSDREAYDPFRIEYCVSRFLTGRIRTGIQWKEAKTGEWKFLPVEPTDIEQVVKEEGSLRVSVTEAFAQQLTDLFAATESSHVVFGYEDRNPVSCLLEWNAADCQMILTGDILQHKGIREVLAYTLMQETLDASLRATSEIPVRWEVPGDSLHGGAHQCKAEEIEGPAVLTTYGKSIWDREILTCGERAYLIGNLRTRLDALEIPYALGTDLEDEEVFVLKLRAEDATPFLLSTLPVQGEEWELADLRFARNVLHLNNWTAPYEITWEETEDGTCGIMLTYTDKNSIQDVETYTEELCREGENLYLRVKGTYIATCVLTEPVKDGHLFFAVHGDETCTPFMPSDAWIVRYLNACLGESMYSLSRSLEPQKICFTDEQGGLLASCTLQEQEELPDESRIMFRKIQAQYPAAEQFPDTRGTDLQTVDLQTSDLLEIYFSDVDFTEDGWMEETVQRFLDIYEISDIRGRRIGGLVIRYIDPANRDMTAPLLQFFLNKSYKEEDKEKDGTFDGTYMLSLGLFSEKLAQRQEEMEQLLGQSIAHQAQN